MHVRLPQSLIERCNLDIDFMYFKRIQNFIGPRRARTIS